MARGLRRSLGMRHLGPLSLLHLLLLGHGCSTAHAPSTDGAVADWPELPECRLGDGPVMEHEVVHGTAGAVGFTLWRCYAGQGSGRSALYRADRFELLTGGATYRATTEAIGYTNTHHNWADSLTAAHTQATLRWHVQFDSAVGLRHFVSASAADGATLLAETEVTVTP